MGGGYRRLFDFYLADELFYFLAVVAESEQVFAGDELFKVEVDQGFIK